MATFLEAVRASDLAALVDVTSPDLAGSIERLLAGEAIVIVETEALARLARRFSSQEESQVEEAVEEFRRLLRESFAAERAAHPDKKTVRLHLRWGAGAVVHCTPASP
jgi:hypothetical protein